MTIVKHCVERLLNSCDEEYAYDYKPILDALSRIWGKGSYRELYEGMVEAHLRGLNKIDLNNSKGFAAERLQEGFSKLDVSRALACANLGYILSKRSYKEEQRALESIPDFRRSTLYGMESLLD